MSKRKTDSRKRQRWVRAGSGHATIIATIGAMGLTIEEFADLALISPHRLQCVIDRVYWMDYAMLECMERVVGSRAPDCVYWLLDPNEAIPD